MRLRKAPVPQLAENWSVKRFRSCSYNLVHEWQSNHADNRSLAKGDANGACDHGTECQQGPHYIYLQRVYKAATSLAGQTISTRL